MSTNSVKIFSIFTIFGLLLIFNNFVVSQILPDESTDESVTKVVEDNADDQKWLEYEPLWKKMEEANAKQKPIIYNGEDGSCAILKNSEYENVDVDNLEFKCLDEFLDYAMQPACGNPKYEMMKTCAQQHVYEGKTFAESSLATGDAYEQMRAFAFLDGCFKCNLAKNSSTDGTDGGANAIEVKVKVKITYWRPAGSFFTNCWEETATATPETIVDFNSKDGIGTFFTLPINFFVRKCDNVFSYDAPPTKYEKIKMEVEHNCNGDGTKMETFTVDLPDFNPKEHAENFAEMRFVQFDLTKGNNGISVWKKNKKTGGAENIPIEDKLDWKINEKNADIPNPNNDNENGGGGNGEN